MKTIAGILAFLSMAYMAFLGVMFWTAIWGGIGFFGSILTSPFSEIIAIGIMMFSSFEAFIGWVIWIAITAVMGAYSAE
jgi:hypothetical protein